MLTDATSGNSIPSGVVITAAAANTSATSLVHIVLNDELDNDIRISYSMAYIWPMNT